MRHKLKLDIVFPRAERLRVELRASSPSLSVARASNSLGRIGSTSASVRPMRRLDEKLASARGQGSTESAADVSEVPERTSAGFGRRLQTQRAGVRLGAAAPSVAEDGGYQETR